MRAASRPPHPGDRLIFKGLGPSLLERHQALFRSWTFFSTQVFSPDSGVGKKKRGGGGRAGECVLWIFPRLPRLVLAASITSSKFAQWCPRWLWAAHLKSPWHDGAASTRCWATVSGSLTVPDMRFCGGKSWCRQLQPRLPPNITHIVQIPTYYSHPPTNKLEEC